MAHPAVQVPFAVASVGALLQGNTLALLAIPGALYYVYLLVQALISAPPNALMLTYWKLKAIWDTDKPLFFSAAAFAYGAMLYFHMPIAPWMTAMAAGLGIITVHTFSKGPPKP